MTEVGSTEQIKAPCRYMGEKIKTTLHFLYQVQIKENLLVKWLEDPNTDSLHPFI